MKKIVLGIIVLFLVCGCGNKEKVAKETSDFETVCSNNKYVSKDIMEEYRSKDYITKAVKCTINEGELEMIVYDTDETAKKIQDKQIEIFNNLRSTGNIIKKETGKNYYKYTMVSNGYYMVSSRIDNTVIFTKITLDEKENIDELLSDIEY